MLWLLLIPAGLAAFTAWCWLAGDEPMAPFHAQALWGKAVRGVVRGQLRRSEGRLRGRSPDLLRAEYASLLPAGWQKPGHRGGAQHHAVRVPCDRGATEHREAAPAAGTSMGSTPIAALALPLSYAVSTQPLMSVLRFILML